MRRALPGHGTSWPCALSHQKDRKASVSFSKLTTCPLPRPSGALGSPAIRLPLMLCELIMGHRASLC